MSTLSPTTLSMSELYPTPTIPSSFATTSQGSLHTQPVNCRPEPTGKREETKARDCSSRLSRACPQSNLGPNALRKSYEKTLDEDAPAKMMQLG